MYDIIWKVRLHSLSIECHLDILLYGCEIWRVGNNDFIERVNLKFCKILLHVKTKIKKNPKSTPDCMVYGELGRFPLGIYVTPSEHFQNLIGKS
jgi:hypothetical protein